MDAVITNKVSPDILKDYYSLAELNRRWVDSIIGVETNSTFMLLCVSAVNEEYISGIGIKKDDGLYFDATIPINDISTISLYMLFGLRTVRANSRIGFIYNSIRTRYNRSVGENTFLCVNGNYKRIRQYFSQRSYPTTVREVFFPKFYSEELARKKLNNTKKSRLELALSPKKAIGKINNKIVSFHLKDIVYPILSEGEFRPRQPDWGLDELNIVNPLTENTAAR